MKFIELKCQNRDYDVLFFITLKQRVENHSDVSQPTAIISYLSFYKKIIWLQKIKLVFNPYFF